MAAAIKTNVKSDTILSYFIKHINSIVSKLSNGHFYKDNATVKEIEENNKGIFVSVDNDGNSCYLQIPNYVLGNDHYEEEFVENLLKHAQ